MKIQISVSAKTYNYYIILYVPKGKKVRDKFASGSTKSMVRSDIKELQKNGHTVVGVRKKTQTSMTGGDNCDAAFSELFKKPA